jgi:sec-independent protein translocase protein TatA
MFGIGGQELGIILLIIIIIFGPTRLPQLADALGKSIRKFKQASREVEDEVTSAVKQEEKRD